MSIDRAGEERRDEGTARTAGTAGDELGAHVSVAGGTPLAPARATEIGARAIQIFTKQPNRWAERRVEGKEAAAFRAARDAAGIAWAASHDSYLINLATPDPALLARSRRSFRLELDRCEALDLDFLVTHPGNSIDGDTPRAIAQNADAIADTLDDVPGSVVVLLEGTAGSGTVLGSTLEELEDIRSRIADRHPDRIGICLDTCHLWAAGYDLRQLDDLVRRLDTTIGLPHLRLLHLNDSATPFDSRRDRHAGIGDGSIGPQPFADLMTHPRLTSIPKVIETPKGDDPVAADRANLARLRGYRSGPRKKGGE